MGSLRYGLRPVFQSDFSVWLPVAGRFAGDGSGGILFLAKEQNQNTQWFLARHRRIAGFCLYAAKLARAHGEHTDL